MFSLGIKRSEVRSCAFLAASSAILVFVLLSGCGNAAKDKSSTAVERESSTSRQTLEEGQVPRPWIVPPVYACSKKIEVKGVLEGADVEILDSNGNVLGQGEGDSDGRAIATLNNPLPEQAGYTIRARQITVSGSPSVKSSPVAVRTFSATEEMPRPSVRPETSKIWECGQNFLVEGVVGGQWTQMYRGSNQVDSKHVSRSGGISYAHYSETPNGTAGQKVRIGQTYCPNGSNIPGPISKPDEISADTMDPDPPLEDVYSSVNSTRVVTRGALMGATLEVAKNGSPLFTHRAVWPDVAWNLENKTTSSDSYAARQNLCGTPSDWTPATIYPEDRLEDELQKPDVESPVCPEPKYVRASASIKEGRFVVNRDRNGTVTGPYTKAEAAPNAIIGIPTPSDFQTGDKLVVKHKLSSGPEASTSVDVKNYTSFEVLGESTFNLIGGSTVEGFVAEYSRGPKFRLEQCCSTGPDEVEAVIQRQEPGGNWTNVTSVMMKKIYRATYTARWDWFTPAIDPPEPNYDYRAVVGELPCDGEGPLTTNSFRVYTSSEPSSDSTAPSAELTVRTTTVSDGGSSTTIKVDPETQTDVSATGYDRESIQKVEVSATAPGTLDQPTSRQVSAGKPNEALPVQLEVDTSLQGLLPRESTDVSAASTNFDGSSGTTTGTPTITVKVPQDDPVIDSISVSEAFTSDTLDIEGEHLYYSNLDTRVVFKHEDASGSETVTASNIGSLQRRDLGSVEIPDALPGTLGTVTVRVEVGTTGDWRTSNTATFELLDRNGTSFGTKVEYGDYDTQNLNGTCSGSGPGHLTDVTFTKNGSSGRGFEYTASFDRKGLSSFNRTLTVYDIPGGSTDGGVWWSSDCRMALVLTCERKSCDSGKDSEPTFFVNGIYFGETKHYTLNQIDVDMYTGTQLNQNFRNMLVVHVNSQGGLLAVSSMSQPQSDSSGPHLIGWVADLRQGRPKISNALSYGKLSKLNDGPNFGPANMYGSISGEKAKVTLNPPDNDDNNPADTKILDLN